MKLSSRFKRALFALVTVTCGAFADDFTPRGAEDTHALQRMLYADLDEVLSQAGETQKAPPAQRGAQPGAEHERLRLMAESLELPVDAFYTYFSPEVYLSAEKGAHYAEISEFVVRYGTDSALAFHLAHEFAHLELGHAYQRMAAEYRAIQHECPGCVNTVHPALTLLSRTDRTHEAVASLRRQHEFEADAWAVRRLVEKGVRIQSAREFLADALGSRNAAPENDKDSLTHPSFSARVAAIERVLSESLAQSAR